MKLLSALLGLFIIAAVFVVSQRGLAPPSSKVAAGHVSATEPEANEAPTPFPSDTSLKFEVLRERVLTPYRLRPDRR